MISNALLSTKQEGNLMELSDLKTSLLRMDHKWFFSSKELKAPSDVAVTECVGPHL